MHLLIEDSSDLFTNPGLLGRYSNRAWFSFGLGGAPGALTISPHGGAAVQLGDGFHLGVTLNRRPEHYDFGNALWPIATAFGDGPGGLLIVPEEGGPVVDTAPLLFPVDLFFGFGADHAPVQGGVNLYYAGGVVHSEATQVSEGSDARSTVVSDRNSHLVHLSIGLAANERAPVRPEGWIRGGLLRMTIDDVTTVNGDDVADREIALDHDTRFGAGLRVHIGDAGALRGVVVSPALQYDGAVGWMHYSNEFDSSEAERVTHAPTAHHVRGGVGVSVRMDDLQVVGTASVVAEELRLRHMHSRTGDEIRTSVLRMGAPEVSLGAELRVVRALLIRAGVRSVVAGSQETHRTFELEEQGLELVEVERSGVAFPQFGGVQAEGGVGIDARRLQIDATVGGLFVEDPLQRALFGRLDLSFSFR